MLKQLCLFSLALVYTSNQGYSANVGCFTSGDDGTVAKGGLGDPGSSDSTIRFQTLGPTLTDLNLTFKEQITVKVKTKENKIQTFYRRQQVFNNIPIWGFVGTWALSPGDTKALFKEGILMQTDIKYDLVSQRGNFTEEESFNLCLRYLKNITDIVDVSPNVHRADIGDLYIYYDPNDGKAKYAYFFEFTVSSFIYPIASAFIFVDTTNGVLSRVLNSVIGVISSCAPEYVKTGGYGGNENTGVYYYGKQEYYNRWLQVESKEGKCYPRNDRVFRVNSAKRRKGIESITEPIVPPWQCFDRSSNIKTFVTDCNSTRRKRKNKYIVNQVNDALFFATTFQEMLEVFEVNYTFPRFICDEKNNNPVRICVHVPQEQFRGATFLTDNSSTCNHSSSCHDIYIPDQGIDLLVQVSPTIIGHELGHSYLRRVGYIAYQGQNSSESSAIEESFCDLCGIMLKAYLNKFKTDWKIGDEIVKDTAKRSAIRYMDNPTADGMSVDHINNFIPDGDSHHNNGIFNKGIYNLATMPEWDLIDVFKLVTWTATAFWTGLPNFFGFRVAVSNLISVAEETGLNADDVKHAFYKVGIIGKCPTGEWTIRKRLLCDNCTYVLSCYKAFSEPTTWNDARETCDKINAKLLTIENKDKYNWLVNPNNTLWNRFDDINNTWTAASNLKAKSIWRWSSTGKKVDPSQLPEFNASGPALQNCLAMMKVNDNWSLKQRDCYEERGFVCQLE